MNSESVISGKRGFYGWYALAGVMVATFFTLGSFLISFAVFLPVVCSEMNWSRAAVSTGLTLGLLCNGLLGPLWGYLVNRFGPRKIIVTGSVVTALGLSGMYLVHEIWHIYVFYSIAGLGVGLAGMVATSTIANNWFVRKRSLAMGIMISAGCLSGFAFPPLITLLMSSLGWRMSWPVMAAIVFIGAGIIGGLLLIRDKPEDMGQLPDGDPPGLNEDIRLLDRIGDEEEKPSEWKIRHIFKMRTTWLIMAFTICYAVALGTSGTHLIAYVQDIGFSPLIAATTLSVVSGIAIVGSLGFGTLAIKFDIRYLASGAFGLQLIGLIILLTTDNLTLIYLFTVLYGIGNGALLVALPTFIGAYYERNVYPTVMGIISPSQVVAQAAAATSAGAIFDATGSYIPAFILVTVFSLAGLVCTLLTRKP